VSRAAAYAIVFVAALALSFFLTWYIRRKATAMGWVSNPSDSRHIHEVAVPRLGGIAIYIASVVLLFACAAFNFLRFDRAEISVVVMLKILAPATLVFLAGLYDDLRGLNPWVKLGCELVAAAAVYFLGFSIIRINLGPYTALPLHGVASFVLSVGWMLAITNAFNLIDGLDGLAAGSTVFSALVLFAVALRYNKDFMGLVAVIIAGAAIGFLRFNFNPATIFLGDSGSLFIGFILSVAAMATSVKSPALITIAIPIACFGLPILDTAFAVMRRTKNGKHLFLADQEHIHHRLLKRGLTHRQAVVALYCVSALFALVGLFMVDRGPLTAAVLLVLGVAVWFIVQAIAKLAGRECQNDAVETIAASTAVSQPVALKKSSAVGSASARLVTDTAQRSYSSNANQ
jgi:UDP-GlcNAc:undecaprenyl-phosphate GlcNAc-1-phosphate transferase